MRDAAEPHPPAIEITAFFSPFRYVVQSACVSLTNSTGHDAFRYIYMCVAWRAEQHALAVCVLGGMVSNRMSLILHYLITP
jgi:hypothetical protein